MPQLDRLSFMPQLIYFFAVFLGTYLILAKSVLPTISRTLKIRARLFDQLEGMLVVASEKEQLQAAYKEILTSFANDSVVLSNRLVEDMDKVLDSADLLIQENVLFNEFIVEVEDELFIHQVKVKLCRAEDDFNK